jgi:NAD(P)-dependent dehydrogenase (short-subunit alcohol dehydrogenase family)
MQTTRVALVTGGTRGIGFAIAEALVRSGYTVGMTGTTATSVQDATTALGERTRAPDRIVGLVCDVRDAAQVTGVVHELTTHAGGLDVLVNNAGVGVGVPIADLSDDEWDRILGTNLSGAFHCCRAAIPHLRARGGGWIVNISSLSSIGPFAGGAAYCASKAGLNAFSDALMQELRGENIRVTLVLPGSVATGFSGRAPGDGGDWRLQPADVAEVVIDLLAHPSRSLPSRVEIRPTRPQR